YFARVLVSPASAGIRCRDAQAAQRLGMGLLQQPSRLAQDQAAEFPSRGGSRERNRGELSLVGRKRARHPLSRIHLVGGGRPNPQRGKAHPIAVTAKAARSGAGGAATTCKRRRLTCRRNLAATMRRR